MSGIAQLARLVHESVDAHVGNGSSTRPLVAIAGSVAVGKTTVADILAESFRASERTLTIVGTDGFLHPNHVLEPLGLMYDKGLPQTYDWDGLRVFLGAARTEPGPLRIPQYSHRIFDIEGTREIELGHAVVVEGINTLQAPVVSLFDLRIYLDAAESVIKQWYVERFLALIVAAESDPTSFYTRFAQQSPSERAETAASVWDTINAPNLHQHIAPTKDAADIVVEFDAAHEVVRIDDRR